MSVYAIGLSPSAEPWRDPDAPFGEVTLDGPLQLFHEEIRRIGTWRGRPLYMRWLDAPDGPMGARFQVAPGVTLGVEYFVPKRVIPDPKHVPLWETERHMIRPLHAEVSRLARDRKLEEERG